MKLPMPDMTFADYFKVNNDVREVVKELQYGFDAQWGMLPRGFVTPDRVDFLREYISGTQKQISYNSEMARREFLIAPVIAELTRRLQAYVQVEVPIRVSPRLQGSLDYLIRNPQALLVIEAKLADLTHGFTQLAVELIALDQWEETDPNQPILYGAVTTGDIWKFGLLKRADKLVVEDLNLYRSPADLHELLPILVGILTDAPVS